jgi:hypothetical protein
MVSTGGMLYDVNVSCIRVSLRGVDIMSIRGKLYSVNVRGMHGRI